jgi:hypothetical protein
VKRTILGVVAGFVAWFVIMTVSDRSMRFFWPDYAAGWPTNTFDLNMMLARLTESTVGLVIAAWIAARVAPASRALPWALGVAMLLFFVPVHYMLWNKFPIWYHAYFLSSLVLVSGIVGTLARPRSAIS